MIAHSWLVRAGRGLHTPGLLEGTKTCTHLTCQREQRLADAGLPEGVETCTHLACQREQGLAHIWLVKGSRDLRTSGLSEGPCRDLQTTGLSEETCTDLPTGTCTRLLVLARRSATQARRPCARQAAGTAQHHQQRQHRGLPTLVCAACFLWGSAKKSGLFVLF